MGHRIIVAVAAVSVLSHTVLGCCAHHAHTGRHHHLGADSRAGACSVSASSCHEHATHHHDKWGHDRHRCSRSAAAVLAGGPLDSGAANGPTAPSGSPVFGHSERTNGNIGCAAANRSTVPHGCPGKGSSHCAELSCSFTIPDAPSACLLHVTLDVVGTVAEPLLGAQALVLPSAPNGSPKNPAPFSMAKLRPHLALAILVI